MATTALGFQREQQMHLISLNEDTRRHMVAEIQGDISDGRLYMSNRLSTRGRQDYEELLLEAARSGKPGSFRNALNAPGRLNETEMTTRNGKTSSKKVPHTAAATLAESEFNRFYIRGLCLRALKEGHSTVRVYRAKQVTNSRPESEALIGREINAEKLLGDLRDHIGVDTVLGLPPGPNSGLSVQLIS